jgi:hypothetical protein
MDRGSRKHVLDWTSRPEFCVDLLQLISPVEARITARSRWMPRGYDARQEARLETFGPLVMPDFDWAGFRKWWLVHERGANTPNWDIALSCEIEERPGLILVEAKANIPELSAQGKLSQPDASAASLANRERISAAITEACTALQKISAGTSISDRSHYQLSNRVAFAWKLASAGIPTVLVYLGFLADAGIADAGAPFVDDAHWKAAFADYAYAVVPQDLFETRIACGAAPAWFLVRSRPVLEQSSSAIPKQP